MDMNTIIQTVLSGGFAELSFQGASYLIQEESNKGWYYLSLWRTAPDPVCISRVFFDVFDGVSEDTLRELFAQPFSKELTIGEMLERADALQTV